jgi:chain length determinant protein EpsF
LTIQRLLRILLARWWVLVLVCGAMVTAAAVVGALLPRQYTATATMVIEPRATDVLGTLAPGQQGLGANHLATQIDILRSDRVATEVVRRLGIAASPAAQRQWREATGGNGTIEGYFAGIISRNLDVKPSRESSVVALSFTGGDPQFAAQAANAFAEAYVATNLALRNQPSRLYADWFDEQLKPLRAEAEAAQSRVSEFQQRNGIVAGDERFDIENARLAELSQQLSIAQSQAVDTRARLDGSSAQVSSVPEVSQTPVVQNLRADLLRAQTRLEQVAQQYGTAHPSHVVARTEVDALQERLERELGNARTTVATVADVTDRRESELRVAVMAQKTRVLQAKALRDELSTLMREAETAQRVFDVARQRQAQTRLDSQNTQSGAYVLNAATAPGEPSSPKTQRNLMLAAGLGLLLGLAAALLTEAADRRIRGAADVEAGAQVPVLGSLPRSAPSWRRRSAGRLAAPASAAPLVQGA